MKDVAKVFVKNEESGKYRFQLKDEKPDISNRNLYGLLGGNIEEGERTETLRKILREAVDTAGLSETQRYWWDKKYGDPRGHQRNHDILGGAKPNLVAMHLIHARDKVKAKYLELTAQE